MGPALRRYGGARYRIFMKLPSTYGFAGAVVILAGCGAGSSYGAMTPKATQLPLRGTAVADAFRRGLYVTAGDTIYGYRIKHGKVRGPACTVKGGNYPGPVAVDAAGDLVASAGGSRSVTVYKGPRMCGPELGSLSDPYGQPADVASNDAATGTIAVANIFDTSGAGSISICKLAGGCIKNLTNANMYEVAGVAMTNNGDCWASATNSLGTATLTYFKKCSGSGMAATGYKNVYYGGLDIDSQGNLVAIDAFSPALWVYKGCNPACAMVGGPFPLLDDCVFGHLNEQSTTFACGDYVLGQIDVYYYSPTSLTYWYSFNNGLGVSDDVSGVAYNPRSRQ